MPNIQTKELNLLPLPLEVDGFCFEFIANREDKKESLLFTRYESYSFFLIIIKRESDYLIKADKLSKTAPIYIIKNALKAFRDAHKLKTTFSNIEGGRSIEHIKESDRYIKDVSYFINEFQTTNEIWIEIGFGSGRHLLYQAKEHPHIEFIGLEIHSPSIEQVAKQCKIQKLENLLICKFDARIFLEFLESNSVGRIFVHFPVPWDKKPHRRVISKEFVDEAIRVLKVGGSVELRTDSENYYAYSYETFISLSRSDLRIRKNREIEISSKYEDRWKKMEKNIYDLILTNDIKSPKKPPFEPLEFKSFIPFSTFKKRFTKKVFKEDDFFVHFEDLFEIDENRGVARVSFGSFQKCEHKYMIFNNNKIQYFPYESLPIEQNIKSHQRIEEFLYG